MSHAAVFIVVLQVYVNSFILKSNYNEFEEKPFFEVYKKLAKFQAEKFLISGYLMTKKFRLQFLSFLYAGSYCMQTWNNRNHSVGFSNTMSKQLEAGK